MSRCVLGRAVPWPCRIGCSPRTGPVSWTVFVEEPGEVSGAHVEVFREFTERVVSVRVRRHQVGDFTEGRRTGRRSLQRSGELGLAAGTLHVHHQGAGDVAGQVRPVVLFDERERQIDSGGHPCRGVRAAVTDVNRVGLDAARRTSGGELVCDPPVRGRALAVRRPAAARMNAPVQIDATRPATAAGIRAASARSRGTGVRG